MSSISTWSTTAGNNNTAPPDGWPEGMAPSAVNDAAREMMAAIRTWYEDAEWIDDGKTKTFVASTQFKISGEDVTTAYDVGRRVRVVAATPGTIYGTITASSFSTDTTVTVSFDSGSLSNETLTVSYASISATNRSVGGMGVDITNTTALTTLADADEILVYDATATANRKISAANFSAGMDYVLIATATASADTYVSFNDIFTTTYHTYKIFAQGVRATTDAKQIWFQLGYGSTPTWETASTYYNLSYWHSSSLTALGVSNGPGTGLQVAGQVATGSATGSDAQDYFDFEMTFNGTHTYSTSPYMRVYEKAWGRTGGTATVFQSDTMTEIQARNGDTTSIRFFAGTAGVQDDTTAVGEFRVYGLKDA